MMSKDRQTTYITHIKKASGIAIGDGAQVIYQGRESNKAAAPPAVSRSLLASTFPTAYAYHLDAKTFPFVSVTLDNTGQGCGTGTVSISAVIEGYSDTAIESVKLAPGDKVQVNLLPLLLRAAFKTLNEIRPATLRVTVEQLAPLKRTFYDQSERIHLKARDTALLALRAPDGSIRDMTNYLAAWVTPRHAKIEQLLRQAATSHPQQRFVGYQGASNLQQAATVVREQAKAIFTALKQDAAITYINSTLNLGRQPNEITQRVRLPSDSLQSGGSANCIDGAVLFASLLELASLEPLIVVVPGQAFVACHKLGVA